MNQKAIRAVLFDLSFLARSRADGTGCLCMLNDSLSELFRERQLTADPLFGSHVFVLLASHRVACCLSSPAKTGSGFRELRWSSEKANEGRRHQ